MINKVQETESFTDTTMLEHFITTPPRGYEHVVDKKNTSQKQVWRSSKVRTNHLCPVHQVQLIAPTKYDLVGNNSKKSGTKLKKYLDLYSLASNIKINAYKSSIAFNEMEEDHTKNTLETFSY